MKDGTAWGIGAGQQNRVEAGQIAASKAAGRAKGGACASDAFYPFPDGIEAAADAGVAVVIQPGGGVKDEDDHRDGRRARPRHGLHRRDATSSIERPPDSAERFRSVVGGVHRAGRWRAGRRVGQPGAV